MLVGDRSCVPEGTREPSAVKRLVSMKGSDRTAASGAAGGFDYSTPEAQEALEGLSGLILEIREEAGRTNRLYERTLGLAVVPVLVKRAAGGLLRTWRQGRRSVR
jgi:hypothetical protein